MQLILKFIISIAEKFRYLFRFSYVRSCSNCRQRIALDNVWLKKVEITDMLYDIKVTFRTKGIYKKIVKLLPYLHVSINLE